VGAEGRIFFLVWENLSSLIQLRKGEGKISSLSYLFTLAFEEVEGFPTRSNLTCFGARGVKKDFSGLRGASTLLKGSAKKKRIFCRFEAKCCVKVPRDVFEALSSHRTGA